MGNSEKTRSKWTTMEGMSNNVLIVTGLHSKLDRKTHLENDLCKNGYSVEKANHSE